MVLAMHPITHLLAGYVLAETTAKTPRDKAVITWVTILPDLDGIGYLVDLVALYSDVPQTHYYETFHRLWGHGLPAAVVICLLFVPWYHRSPKVLLAVFASVHLHFALDLLGSRGELSGTIWPIYYLAPFSPETLILSFPYQWPLGGWQNASITLALIGFGLWRGWSTGYSPLSLLSKRADQALIRSLRSRFGEPDGA
jgi:hypothetical protein